jgi:hypothetical protein
MPSGYCHCGYVLQGPSEPEIERILAQHRHEQHGGPKPASAAVAEPPKPEPKPDDKPAPSADRARSS